MVWPANHTVSTPNWAGPCLGMWHASDATLAVDAVVACFPFGSGHAASAGYATHARAQSWAPWPEVDWPGEDVRELHRARNERQSGHVTAGMLLLLALCGWIGGGNDGVRRAVESGLPSSPAPQPPSAETMRRRFNARRLTATEAPDLMAALASLCRSAGLARMPEIYVLPGGHAMNAYAFGNRDSAAITLTEALLSGMTHEEVVAILAHEIAHIASDDGATMALAASLRRAIAFAAWSGLYGSAHPRQPPHPLSWVLGQAPAIAELLCLALSRLREHAADAAALEWIANPAVLASALEKLERHHRWTYGPPLGFFEAAHAGYVNSHPSTDQRLHLLRRLA